MSNRQLQPRLVCENTMDMLDSLVKALGGPKAVGKLLWPAMDADAAGHRVRDCVNPNRRERLCPEEFLALLKLAREQDFHSGFEWVGNFTGYAVKAVEPEDEKARLMREFIDATALQVKLSEQLRKHGLA